MRRPYISATAMALGLLGGCATSTPGWTGSGAQRFDEALAQCRNQVAVIANEQEREAALQDCMRQKGWTRR